MSSNISELKSLIDLTANENKANLNKLKEKLNNQLNNIIEEENK